VTENKSLDIARHAGARDEIGNEEDRSTNLDCMVIGVPIAPFADLGPWLLYCRYRRFAVPEI